MISCVAQWEILLLCKPVLDSKEPKIQLRILAEYEFLLPAISIIL